MHVCYQVLCMYVNESIIYVSLVCIHNKAYETQLASLIPMQAVPANWESLGTRLRHNA